MRLNLKEVWSILDLKEKRQMISVSFVQLFSGLSDVLGVLSIMPFLTMATNPEIATNNKYVNLLQNWTNFNDKELIVFFGLFSFLVIAINQSVRIFSAWYASFINQSIWRTLTKRMFGYFLGQNYSYHLKNNSYAMLEKLSVQVNSMQAGIIVPLHELFGFVFSSLFVLGALLFLHPLIVLASIIFFGFIYIIMFRVYKKKFERLGTILTETSSNMYKLYGDAFGSIKEIKILHNENFYTSTFTPIAKKHSETLTKSRLFTDLPYSVAEIVGFGGLMMLTLILLFTSSDFKSIVPTLGLFAFALKKVIPSVNGMYKQVSVMKFYQAAFNAVKNELAAAFSDELNRNKNSSNSGKIEFKKILELSDLTFSYDNSKSKTIDSISLKIKKGSFIGISGSTGSGKTTMLDLILGLLTPQSGKILIDGEALSENNLLSWHSKIGYIAQDGFLSDKSIAKNIAFGAKDENIDLLKIKKCAKLAIIDDFIENQLADKYETIIGERGIRLSGGQRQRIRIARALYREPEILVLDEATNALDVTTEERVMRSLKGLPEEITVIMVSHRISILRNCDNIIFLGNKKIEDEGKYDHLQKTNSKFREFIEKQQDYSKNELSK